MDIPPSLDSNLQPLVHFQREAPRMIDGRPAHIVVIGSGAFGSALCHAATAGGCEVTVVSHERERKSHFDADPILSRCHFEYQHDTNINLADYGLIVVAVASHAIRAVATWIRERHERTFPDPQSRPLLRVVCASKGIERNTLLLPSQILQECLPPGSELATLSGPAFAKELRLGLPAALVAASRSADLRHRMKTFFHRALFRIYDSEDQIGIEVAGALKNVIAIVAGGCDGLGLGANARAAVVTRGFGEIVQIGVKLGADPMTFLGLGGIGDLFLTTSGDLSRNRQLGLRLAKGETKEAIVNSMGEVVEGIGTAESAFALSRKYGLDTPIIQVAYGVLYENLAVREALLALVTRHHKSEFHWTEK